MKTWYLGACFLIIALLYYNVYYLPSPYPQPLELRGPTTKRRASRVETLNAMLNVNQEILGQTTSMLVSHCTLQSLQTPSYNPPIP